MNLGYQGKKRILLLAWALFAALISFPLGSVSLIKKMELSIRSLSYAVAKNRGNTYDVVVVGIDEISFEDLKKDPELGRWKKVRYPWPPALHAELLTQLAKLGASKVGFDLLFTESFEEMYKPEYGSFAVFIDSRERADVPVTLASKIEEGILVKPLPELLASGFSTGLANVPLYFDTVLRYDYLQGEEPSLALSLALAEGGKRDLEALGWTAEKLKSKPLIRYRESTRQAFPYVSYTDILLNRLPQPVATRWGVTSLSELLNGKCVLVGATSLSAHDIFDTPLGEMFGVEIQAHALQMLGTSPQNTFREPGPPVEYVFPFICALFGMLVMLKTGSLWRISCGFLFPVLFFLYAGFSALSNGLLIPVVAPLFGFFIVLGGAFFIENSMERSQRSFLQGAFGKYVSPVVAQRLMENPDLVKLGGREEAISILFSDIAGFTTFSEQLSPEELIRLINAYLHHMSLEVLKSDGTLDKFIGDAIMAFWGAPIAVANHARSACQTALSMKEKLIEFNEKHHPFPRFPLQARIGINTGKAVVGNAGCELRFSYTAIGDSVNLASRLESLGKHYGVGIIIGGKTEAMVSGEFDVRLLDRVAVKGKTEPTDIFELLGRKGQANPSFIDLHEKCMTAYFAGEWDKAAELFYLKKEQFGDHHSDLFLDRIAVLKSSNPDQPAFSGVWTLTSK
jgi:adenylate cyclase